MKGNIFPKKTAQVYFYLGQDKYTKKLMFLVDNQLDVHFLP
jgi:hypothetical protein